MDTRPDHILPLNQSSGVHEHCANVLNIFAT